MNECQGHLSGDACPQCKNKGVVYVADGTYVVARECSCMPARKAYWRLKQSGLADSIERYTFENFQVREPWQKAVKDTAVRFLHDQNGAWFFAGGQPGAGKTHICTAIVGALLKRGLSARYMLWKDESTWLKGRINEEAYDVRVEKLKTVPVLYIDDFFKTPLDVDGTPKKPTPGDVNLAFEILNARYVSRKPTLITSERLLDELLDFDEAIGSRVYERSKGYTLNLSRDRRKNWRLKA